MFNPINILLFIFNFYMYYFVLLLVLAAVTIFFRSYLFIYEFLSFCAKSPDCIFYTKSPVALATILGILYGGVLTYLISTGVFVAYLPNTVLMSFLAYSFVSLVVFAAVTIIFMFALLICQLLSNCINAPAPAAPSPVAEVAAPELTPEVAAPEVVPEPAV